MAAKSPTKSSKRDDVEALLSDLDNLESSNRVTISSNHNNNNTIDIVAAKAATPPSSKADDAQSLLDDLDDLVKRRAPTPKKTSLLSTPSGTPTRLTKTLKKDNGTAIPANTITMEGSSTSNIASDSSEPLKEVNVILQESKKPEDKFGVDAPTQPSWGTWWSSATKLADQARAELEKRAAQVQSQVSETTKEATEGGSTLSSNTASAGVPWVIAQNVNSFLKNNRDLNKLKSDFSKVGIKGWNELLNVVVPPIEKHEILSITLSHDMVGFDGISDVVFAVLQKVMETHASSHHTSEQQLVVNKAPLSSVLNEDKQSESEDSERNMKAVTGFEQGWKLAETKLSQLIEIHNETNEKSSKSNNDNGISLPITTCPLFIRIQPVLDFMPGIAATPPHMNPTHLFLEILLKDPTNSLTHKTISQPIPKAFIDLDFEDFSWVEELLSESLQGALGSIGLEYIQGRNLGTSLRSDVVEASEA